MSFDTFTALAASSLVALLFSVILLYLWLQKRQSAWLAYWAAGFGVLGLGTAITTLKPGHPDPFAMVGGNALLVLGFSLAWTSMRVFEGRRPRPVLAALPVAVWLALICLEPVYSSLMARIVLLSLLGSIGFGLAAWELWRGRAEHLPSKQLAVALLALGALVYLFRILLVRVLPYPMGMLPTSGLLAAGVSGFLVIEAVVVSVLLISMAHERTERGERRLATTDPLTGMLNRRGLGDALRDDKLPPGAALIMFDLDRFKQINDTFGHAAGDELLKSFALVCKHELRQTDLAVRIGGEEFVLILTNADAASALALAERIRVRHAETVVPIEGGALAGTVSGGIFCAPPNAPVWLSAALAEADRAMYLAKAAGRNRVFDQRHLAPASRGFDERCVAQQATAASG